MRKIRIKIIAILGLSIITSCNKNTKKEAPQEISQVEKLVEKVTDEEKEIIKKKKIEKEIEEAMNNFQPAIEFITEYNFTPIDDYNLQLVDIQVNESNDIECSYDGSLLCTISGSDKIQRIDNFCIPYSEGRLYSSSIQIVTNDKYYYGIINLEKGILKYYRSLQTEHHHSEPFFSGKSKYFIIENIREVYSTYYDYKKYQQIHEVYGGYIEIYNFDLNQLVYKIDRRQFLISSLVSIGKILYEEDGFYITLANFYDSNEFVKFKLFTENDNFHYEIYDKYLYSEDE